MKKTIIFLSIIAVLFLILFRVHGQPAHHAAKMKFDGLERSYILHMPDSFGTKDNHALVIALHGGYSKASGMEALTGLNHVSDREGFLVAYPDGIDRHWNDGRETVPNNVDDVAFISSLIDRLISQYRVDPKQIFATGISNGGFLSLRLACDLSEKIAAVAPVAASMSETKSKHCDPSAPVSVLLISGTGDPLVPYEGGEVRHHGRTGFGGRILSVPDSAAWWADKNGCSRIPTVDSLSDRNPRDGTNIERMIYSGGRQGTEVQLVTIRNGGHTWPGGWQYLPAFLIGRTSRDLDASEAIWNFFKQHSR